MAPSAEAMNAAMSPLSRRLVAEVVATMMLILLGCGAIVVNFDGQNLLGLVGVSLAWMYLISVLIYAFGNISGTQINPAVTVALWSIGKMPRKEVLPHILAQMVGAILGAAILLGWLGNVGNPVPLGGTAVSPTMSVFGAFTVEYFLSFFLMASIMGSGIDTRTPRGFAALAIGMAIAVASLVGGPLTGASMNPARSFGPALVSWLAGAGERVWRYHWIYWLAPPMGTISAAWVLTFLRADEFVVRQKQQLESEQGVESSESDHRRLLAQDSMMIAPFQQLK